MRGFVFVMRRQFENDLHSLVDVVRSLRLLRKIKASQEASRLFVYKNRKNLYIQIVLYIK